MKLHCRLAHKAQYHSACITNYLLKWKKEHSADNYSTIKNESEHDITFKKFLDILHHDLFENKKAFTMSSLLDKFCSLLPEGLLTKYSAKLQTRLQNHYGDTIVIESQKGQGQSNIVFSSSISVADAIRAASKLKADLKFSEVEASFVDVPDMQEDQILHDAAKVLRGSLNAVEISKDFYPSPSDLSHHRSLQFFPPSLMTFLSWLVDGNCFHVESDYNALSHDKARKCIAVAKMIISLHKNNFTPFNLGLALQLYHGYGSNHLIETLHAFGTCASYPEVRQFLTNAANNEIANTDVSCIPCGISPKTLGGDFIQEGADNIDLNTETTDRKNTMHSMARAVFQVMPDHTPTSEIISTKLKRGQDRSLSMTEETTSLMTCLPYRKPKERHGPQGILTQ
jgi:hypothetical protein